MRRYICEVQIRAITVGKTVPSAFSRKKRTKWKRPLNVAFKNFATAIFQKQIYKNYLKPKKYFSVSSGLKLVSKFYEI
jgi:hypothetical protein